MPCWSRWRQPTPQGTVGSEARRPGRTGGSGADHGRSPALGLSVSNVVMKPRGVGPFGTAGGTAEKGEGNRLAGPNNREATEQADRRAAGTWRSSRRRRWGSRRGGSQGGCQAGGDNRGRDREREWPRPASHSIELRDRHYDHRHMRAGAAVEGARWQPKSDHSDARRIKTYPKLPSGALITSPRACRSTPKARSRRAWRDLAKRHKHPYPAKITTWQHLDISAHSALDQMQHLETRRPAKPI